MFEGALSMSHRLYISLPTAPLLLDPTPATPSYLLFSWARISTTNLFTSRHVCPFSGSGSILSHIYLLIRYV